MHDAQEKRRSAEPWFPDLPPVVVLHPGRNTSGQEFYEDRAATLIVWRYPDHADSQWYGARMRGGMADTEHMCWGDTLEAVTRQLHDRFGVRVALDLSIEWRPPYVRNRMSLIAVGMEAVG